MRRPALETEGAQADGGILIGSPIYVPMEDDTREELMPGEIAFRAMDQNIVVGRVQPQGTHNSEVCMAGMVNVFAQALTDLQELPALPERFQVRSRCCSAQAAVSWGHGRPDKAGVAEQVDLDASCILLDEQFNVIEIVHTRRARNANGSVVHTGDSKSGEGGWDEERIYVFLPALPGRFRPSSFS